MEPNELPNQRCLCGTVIIPHSYALCAQCAHHSSLTPVDDISHQISSLKKLIEQIEQQNKQDPRADLQKEENEHAALSQEQLQLNKEYEWAVRELQNISEENAGRMIKMYKDIQAFHSRKNQESLQITEIETKLMEQQLRFNELTWENDRLRNFNIIDTFFRFQISNKHQKGYLNSQELVPENLHLLLPLIEYLLSYETPSVKATRKHLSYIDLEEMIIVVKEKHPETGNIREKEVPIDISHPQIWLSYVEMELNDFVLRHKIDYSLESSNALDDLRTQSPVYKLICLLNRLLKWTEEN